MKLLFVVLVASLLLFSGCDILFGDSGISPDDPYTADCVLKESYHHDWKKYSHIDPAIPPESRSVEAKNYYAALNEYAVVTGTIHMMERDRAVRSLMIQETKVYKQAVSSGHKKNLIKSFIRMSFYTTEVINDNANVGKGFAKTFLDPEKNAIQLVGEAIKIAEAYVPTNSSLALDTSTSKGQMLDVSKSGAIELMTSWGTKSVKDVPKNMAKKAEEYLRGKIGSLYPQKPGVKYVPLPEITLSDDDLALLKQEYLKLHELDNIIQDAEKINFQDMWAIRELTQEQTDLKNKLFDYEHDEKDRVDAKLIADCKRKTSKEDKGIFSFLRFLGGGNS